MVKQVSRIFSCKACAEFWKLKTVVVLVLGLAIGVAGLGFVPKTPASELAHANSTIIIQTQ